MTGQGDHFAALIEPVARMLFGEPNKSMSSKKELRFGKRGSLSVDLDHGRWFKHGDNVGGGVLDMIEQEKGLNGREAIEWIRENGIDVPDRAPPARAPSTSSGGARPKIVKTYPYLDENGGLLFEVVRFEPKDFRQRRKARPDDPPEKVKDGWVWSVKGCRQVPYRMAELREAIAGGLTVFVVEGEKDVENLAAIGVPATSNAQGAGKWPAEITPIFADADVVIIRDNDDAGRSHANVAGAALESVARQVRCLDLPGLPEKGDVSDWLEAGGSADQLYDLVADQAWEWCPTEDAGPSGDAPSGPFVSKFAARPWIDLDAQGEPHEWLIKGVMTRGEVAMMAGPSGCGKSFLALDLAMAICRGERWFGNWTRTGGVIYQAGEGKRGLFKRLKAHRIEKGLSLSSPLDFVLMPAALNLYAGDDHTAAFIAECKHWKATFSAPLELIVIDTFGAATSGADENASRDMGPVLERCVRISEALKSAVLLVHHMNAGGTKARGWTGITANIDSVISVARLDTKDGQPIIDNDRRHIREFVTTKQKDGEDGKRWRFVLPSVEIARDQDGDPVTSCVVRAPNGDSAPGALDKPTDTGLRLSDQGEVFMRAINRALDDFGEDAPAALRLPRGAKVVRWKYVTAAFAALGFEGDAETDPVKRSNKIAQAAKRHGERLMSLRVIMRENPFVWLTGRKVRGFAAPAGKSNVEDVSLRPVGDLMSMDDDWPERLP